jgi:hypothetical protein
VPVQGGRPDAEVVAGLWDEGFEAGVLRDELPYQRLEGCAALRWHPDNASSVLVVVLRFPDEERARLVASMAGAELHYRQAVLEEAFFPFAPDRPWARVERDPGYLEFTGVLWRDRYVAFVRAHPIGPAIDRELFMRVAREQYDRLAPR